MLERKLISKKVAWKNFASLLGKLPLEKCTIAQNSLTGERGWVAPDGQAFKVTGHFIVNSNQSDIANWYGPNYSAKLLKTEYAQYYHNALEECEGDKKLAWKIFLEDLTSNGVPTDAPTSFIGKWLVVSPDLTKPFSKDEQVPLLMIKDEIKAWYDQEYFGAIDDLAPESDTITSCLFYSHRGVEKWIQYYAEAVLGYCRITFVNVEEKIPKLFEPEFSSPDFIFAGKRGFWVKTAKRVGDQEKAVERDFKQKSGYVYTKRLTSDLLVAGTKRNLIQPTQENLKAFLSGQKIII